MQDEDHFVSCCGCLQTIASAETESLEKSAADHQSGHCRFELAASNLRTSQSYLGAQFRRFRASWIPRRDQAMAAKLAVWSIACSVTESIR